jgi:3-deoxy-manno-octulosonate cytidylyltransferase (CMP-KDO synthetase)
MATAATPFAPSADPKDPNLVKVVIGLDGRAVYFSRSPIPFWREPDFAENQAYYLHLGIYAYRREFLLQYAAWPPTPLEKTEKLEQLRALEHGRSIYVLKVNRATHGIDTAEQYAAFVVRQRAAGSGQRAEKS